MVTPFQLNLPGRILFGRGKFAALPELTSSYGRKVMILTGARSFQQSPFYKPLIKGFEDLSMGFEVIGISGEPSPMLIDGITTKYRRKEVEVIVAIGGGSVIDTGKAVSAMLPINHSVYEYLEGIGSGKTHSGKKLPFIAVPTTAGTGSETTKNAVLSDVNHDGFKKSIRHDAFIPDIALIDPDLTLTCPVNVTAACGLDAYTQLLESYVSINANPMTDALAYSGLEKISASLPEVVANLSDVEARVNLSYASMISGITLANAGLGIVHGFASAIGGFHDVPHGIVCGTLLSASVRENIMNLQRDDPGNITLKKYAKAGRLFRNGLDDDMETNLKALIKTLDEWTVRFNVPKLGEYGVKQADADKILKETGQKQNPVQLDEKIMKSMLTSRI
jgi:alcohol dehydrogenase class IV